MPAFLLDATLKGSAILLLAAGITALMRRRSAAARHLVWCFALFSAAALPVAALVLPAWTIRLPAASSVTLSAAKGTLSEAPRGVTLSKATRGVTLSEAKGPITAYAASAGSPRSPSALFIIWVLVGALLLARLLAGLVRLSRLARYAFPVDHPRFSTQLYGAVRALGLTRPVRLLRSDEVSVPVTWGIRRPTVVLPAECVEWSEERLRAVLIHELAHAARWDFGTQLGAELCAAVYWFNPLTWVALRGMRAERERACDDRVLTAGTRASAYATELLELARVTLRPEPPRVALAMARRSEIEGRLLAILNPAVRRGGPRAGASLFFALPALAFMLPLSAMQVDRTPRPVAPAQETTAAINAPAREAPTRLAVLPVTSHSARAPEAKAAPSPAACDYRNSKGSSSHQNISDNGRRTWKVSWTGEGCSVDLVAHGEVKFNADFTDISDITQAGYLELTVKENGRTRRIELQARNGSLKRTYLVDGEAAPWDDAAREWFARFLIELDRHTGFAIEARFPALLQKGNAAVFDEIDQLASDYVRGLWYRKLFTEATLSPPEVRRAARGAGTTMESDYELGRVLAALGARYSLADAEVRNAFIDAAGTLESDYERAQLLLVVISRGPVTPEAAPTVVKLVGAMSSDYEKARVLLALGASAKIDPRIAAPDYLDVVTNMESDYERGRVLKLILESGQLSKESLVRVIGVVERMSSDYEAANVLIALAGRNTLDEAVRTAYLRAADKFDSDYESNRAKAALARRG